MKILVPVNRVIDYNVKVRVKGDGSGVYLANVKMSMNPFTRSPSGGDPPEGEGVVEECQELCVSSGRSGIPRGSFSALDRLEAILEQEGELVTAVDHPLTVREVFSWPRIAR